jgi:UDP-N-acetylglucosamine 2-epimerase (non-hydrolysing)
MEANMLLVVFGTRPEWIKIKPVLDEIQGKIPYSLLFTGQHTSLVDKSIEDYGYNLLKVEDFTGNRLDSIVYSLMKNFDSYTYGVTHVLVQGDTTSAFAAALCAFHRKIPVIHLEAGLRSYDKNNPYPEEFNRRAISSIADIHLCPTKDSADNLRREGVLNGISVVGNTGLDGLLDYKVTTEEKVIITLHRRENHEIVSEWFKVLSEMADKFMQYRFIFVKHPNPNISSHIDELLPYVDVIDPVSRDEMAKLLSSCSYVITDSGGLQEEAAFFKKPCIVLRKTTERPEGLGVFSFLCESPSKLYRMFSSLCISEKISEDKKCPYGDGRSSEKVLEILERNINV